MMLKRLLILILPLLAGCNLTQQSVDQKNNTTLPELKISRSKSKSLPPAEQELIIQNRIPDNAKDPFLNLYLSFLNVDDIAFLKNAEHLLKTDPAHPMTPWIIYYLYQKARYFRIPHHQINKLFDLPQKPFPRYLTNYYRNQLQQKFMLSYQDPYIKNRSKWDLKGPYRFHQYLNPQLLLQNKFPEIKPLFQHKTIDFKDGSLSIPESISTTALYHFQNRFHTDKEQRVTFFMSSDDPVICLIDGKILFHQPLNHYQQLKHRFQQVTLSPGTHTINLILFKMGSGKVIFKHTPLQEVKGSHQTGIATIEQDQNTTGYLKTIANLPGYHHALKGFWLAEMMISIFNNVDYAYPLIKNLPEDNFYRNFLMFRFYENNRDVPRGIKNEKRQHYLKKSLSKNPRFLKTNIAHSLFYHFQHPYKSITKLSPLSTRTGFFPVHRALIELYRKTNQHHKALNHMKQFSGRCDLLMYHFESLLRGENLPLFQRCTREIEQSDILLQERKKYRAQDHRWMVQYIQNHPCEKRSLALFYILKQSGYSQLKPLQSILYDHFSHSLARENLKEHGDIKQFLKDLPLNSYRSARFFENDFPKKFTHREDIDIIDDFERNSSTTISYPTTRVFDQDTVMILSPNSHITINHAIIKLNTKSGVNQYATLTRRKKYLKIATIDGKTHQLFRPDGNQQTSEISLNNLKIGDYVVTITYQLNHFPFRNDLFNWGNFFYRSINSDLFRGELNLYISKNVKPELIPINGFLTKPTKSGVWKNFNHLQYKLPPSPGIKQEYFAPRSILFYVPSLQVISGVNQEKILHTFRTAILYSLQQNSYLNTMLKSEKAIKTVDDLKKLVERITRDYRHMNAPYSKPITTYLSKQGNLVLLLHYMLKQMNIESDIMIYHTSDNFLSSKIPDRGYYTYFTLNVTLNNQHYRIDPSNHTLPFNTVNPYTNGMPLLRVDHQGNVFQEQGSPKAAPQSRSNLSLTFNTPEEASATLSIELPGYLGASIKSFVEKQSSERLKMIFEQWLTKKTGYIKNFKFEIKHLKEHQKPLTLHFTFTLEHPAQRANGTLIISDLFKKDWGDGFYNRGLLHQYTMLQERHTPVEIRFFNHQSITTITPPKGYQIAKPQLLDETNRFGHYKHTFQKLKTGGIFTTSYQLKTALVMPDQYPELVKFSNAVKQIRGARIVLEKTAP